MTRKLFGTDGIRGKAGQEPLTVATLERFGYTLALQMPGSSILIGHDGRESGETLVAASTAQLFSPSATDPTQALFNLLQSETAFSANIAAFSRISEVEDSLLDIMA